MFAQTFRGAARSQAADTSMVFLMTPISLITTSDRTCRHGHLFVVLDERSKADWGSEKKILLSQLVQLGVRRMCDIAS